MTDLVTFADVAPILAVEHRPGVSRRSITSGTALKVDQIFFENGVATDDHGHAAEQAAYHISGRFEVAIGGVTVELAAGDGYSIPPMEEHSVRCLEAGSYILVTVGDGHEEVGDHAGHDHAGHDHGLHSR